MPAGVLLPAAIRDGLPEDLRPLVRATLDVGDDDPGPGILEEVTGFIPPYMCPADFLAVMARMPRLRWVQAQTAGVDGFWEHLPAGVALANAAGVHDASTSELAVGLMLASLRGIDRFARAMPDGAWSPQRYPSLADRTVAIVGFGGVGRAVARRLAGFECQVQAFARSARTTDRVTVHPLSELPERLPGFEVVVLCLPLTGATVGLVDAGFLAAMAQGALLVNVARGPVVDTGALLAECASGRLRAALDVTDPEPLPPEHPLWRTPGVLVSPHVGGNSSAFQPRMDALVARQLRRVLAGEPLAHVLTRP